MLRDRDLLMEDLQREGLRFKTSIGARIGCLIKFFLSFISLGMIWFPTLSRKRERVLVHQLKNQLVESVARSTMVIDLRGYTGLLVVVKRGTGLGIFLMLGVNTMVVVNLMQVVQMRLQKRTTSMLSSLGVSKRLLPMW